MSEHLTHLQLSALADGELAGEELRAAKEHIDDCLACARAAVDEWLMKAAAANAGRRYEAPESFRERMARLVLQPASLRAREPSAAQLSWNSTRRLQLRSAWALAAALLVGVAASVFTYRTLSSAGGSAELDEACDLHIAALAANQAPQVVSSDRHTVKPWFQGKLPFSFNLPETLPADTVLDGANLVYLDNHPAAQLLFSISHHRVSVFVEQRPGKSATGEFRAEHAGFHEDRFAAGEIEGIAVSDVDPARLSALVECLQGVQDSR